MVSCIFIFMSLVLQIIPLLTCGSSSIPSVIVLYINHQRKGLHTALFVVEHVRITTISILTDILTDIFQNS
ncbi:hypothetical protein C8Q75DRAFT_759711 [Abortiporus biennis]|nr:hypothetical protein C8Q75DRAFT_759711 [Abortiporus biennis]